MQKIHILNLFLTHQLNFVDKYDNNFAVMQVKKKKKNTRVEHNLLDSERPGGLS